MKTLANKMTNEVKRWIYRNARPIDLMRWQYHFENGCHEAVLEALAMYQNTDGGFGTALEADSWNPYSTPIQTYTATEILHEIEYTDNESPIITGILRYLDSEADFTGKIWLNSVLSNNDYPHAPWWETDTRNTAKLSYNPTAALAGFGLCFSSRDSELFDRCARLAQEATDCYLQNDYLEDMHIVQCYIRLLDYCQKAKIYDIIDVNALQAKLRDQVNRSITKDTAIWLSSYICKPSHFNIFPNSPFYDDIKELAEYECRFIIETRNDNGVWQVTWSWDKYPREWAIVENWWKASIAIQNMLYLKKSGYLFRKHSYT